MIGAGTRVFLGAAIGAAAGAVCLVIAFNWHPSVILDMDRDLPRRLTSGLYPIERAGETTFAWTSRRSTFTLNGLDRHVAWVCSVTLRGGRADPATQPVVDVGVDGITLASETATNEFRELQVTLPPRATDGLVLTLDSSKTIVPGGSDTRELGVQLDRLACAPAARSLVLPPGGAVVDAALSAALFGAVLAFAGVSAAAAAFGAVAVSAAQAFSFSSGLAPYIGFSDRMLWFAVWIFALTAAGILSLEWVRKRPLESTARFVLLFSGAALYVKLLALLHPSKLLIDAVFHAHRFEWVLSGRYYFTQGMPGGVSFPYAIGLYVFAAPWAALTRDHVTLLRVVVCSAEIVSGALLYPLLARAWGHRATAALAVVLFNLVPLPYGLVGNANLTNAFGQSVALAALVAASMLPPRPGRSLPVVGLFGLCAGALLCHVSTFALLTVTLGTLAVLYRWRGGKELHRTAWRLLAVTVVAALFAIVLYYGHFGDVYRTALRVRSGAAATTTQAPAAPVSPAAPPAMSLAARIANAVTFTVAAIGWPILILAAVGIWRLWADGMHDRAALLSVAWCVATMVFLGAALSRVDAPFQRYAAEFFGRVLLATYPAAVLLAANGARWAWRAGPAGRAAASALVLCAVVIGLQHWAGWIA